MSRMEMDLDLEPAFFDPPETAFGSNEPTVAISLKSDVNDQTKPPPGVVSRKRKITPPPKPEKPEPITLPVKRVKPEDGEGLSRETIPSLPFSGSDEQKRKFRKSMKTSQLSDLLKKAKKEKQAKKNNRVVKPPKTPSKTAIGTVSLTNSATKPVITVPKSIKNIKEPKKPKESTEDSLLIQLQALDKKLSAKPGFASEKNQGSGFIKLPTTDILDVLGTGQFRLRVQDIIYEPVDEKGLTQLIKGGVLLGAEDIAEANGDWMPISDHPVFSGLRERMAKEAHSLLSKVASGKTEKKPLEVETLETKPLPPSVPKPTAPVETKRTMQMFAMDREAGPIISPSLAESIEEIPSDAIAPIDAPVKTPREAPIKTPPVVAPPLAPAEAPIDEDRTREEVFDPSSIAIDLTESEISIGEPVEPKKKSAFGILSGIIVLLALALAALFWAHSNGMLDFASGKKTAKTEKKDVEKKVEVEKNADDTRKIEESKKIDDTKKEPAIVDTKVDETTGPPEKEETKEEPKEEPKETKEEPIVSTTTVESLSGAKLVGKASGKKLAFIFEKENASFLLIPEVEEGGLRRILAAQKLCEVLECPFASNKVKQVTIEESELTKLGAKSSAMIVKDGKINTLLQPIAKGSYDISTTASWRPILKASQAARSKDIGKWMEKNNLKMSNKEFSRQLGGMLLRDFLINDWNRFESKPSHIGVVNGKLVDQASIVAFEARASGRVKGRFGWGSVYPAEMVAELKKLDKEATLELLFPNASTTDKARFGVFWKQRTNALERIKALSAKSGKENVLLIK